MWRRLAISGETGEMGQSREACKVRVTDRVREVAGLFGLGLYEPRRQLWDGQVEVEISAGDVVLIVGNSGAGKSTFLGRVEAGLRRRSGREGAVRVQRLEEIAISTRLAVVDCFGGPVERALEMLSRAGLAEARVWLQRPRALSEGEQFRYRLAQFIAGRAQVLIADEFAAAVDRVTARVVAWQLGRFVRESVRGELPRAAVVATSHADVEEDLRPTVVVRVGEGSCVVERRR